MTHDPLCYLSFACLSSADGHHSHAVDGAPGVTVMHCVACNRDCVCYLITKVRADALQKAFEAVEDLVDEFAYNDDISAQDVFDVIDALRGES